MTWNQEAALRAGYVLFVEHEKFRPTISVHDTLSGAETVLRELASAFLSGHGEWTDQNLVERLAEYGDRVRVFKCSDTGGNDEVTPFEQ
jgi:hypothetical protein